MTMIRFLPLLLLATASKADAIVIRHDVDDAAYLIRASAFQALVDLPGEGHGVLIGAQWVVTAAHAVPSPCMEDVTINGERRTVERVVMHPGYKRVPAALVDEAVTSGDASGVAQFLAESDDIALLKLASPFANVTPVALYRGNDETGPPSN